MNEWRQIYYPLLSNLSGSAERFVRESANLQNLQEAKLFEILRVNADTPHGQKFSFRSLTTISEYREAVPLTIYEEYDFDDNSQSAVGLKGYAWSSGTSSNKKRIPVTTGLVGDYESALLPWLDSLFREHQNICSGPSYWIVSPPFEDPSEDSPLQDSLYFSDEVGQLLFQALTLPPKLGKGAGFREWAYVTLLHLLLEPALSWISLWSPSLLCRLLESIDELRPLLIESLQTGTSRLPGLALGESAVVSLDTSLETKKERLPSLLEQIQRSNPKEAVLPNLKLCSCWADGWAALFIQKLQSYLPGVVIQPKGLLATEAVVTIPWPGGEPVLAYQAHFFEFISTASRKILLAHELELGEIYEVVVTTSGGLYRYQLEDAVKVTGFLNSAPRLTFLGKVNAVVDLCGEKLHEAQVAECFRDISTSFRIELSGCRLRPVIEESQAYYELVIPKSYSLSEAELSYEVDRRLRNNPHYHLCRELRQLGEVAVVKEKQVIQEKSTDKLFCLIRTPRVDESNSRRVC